MDWFAKWRLKRAAKHYAQRLPRRLRQGWGASKTYTQGQIDAAVRDLRLDPRYVLIAYAVFLLPEDLAANEAAFVMFTSEEAKGAFDSWRPVSTDWSSNDAYDGGYAAADNHGNGGHHGGGGGHH
jgi:hypothetical protein